MICYNVENATDAFLIDLGPDADRIRAPFERAIEIANTARDEGTATALRKLLADLQTAHEKLTMGEKTESAYKAQLADVAASVRGLLADIAEDGTKRTDTAQPPAIATVELVPEQAALLTKAADNSQATVDEVCEWRGYIKQLIAGYDGDGISPSPLTANKQQAIYERWDEYTTDCKRKHTRPTYEGCLDEHGGANIYKGHTLLELVQTAQGLERVVHNVKEQARRK